MLEGSLRRPKLALSLAMILATVGFISWLTMPRLEDPTIPDRNGIVLAVYPGADPETLERLVADPIEEKLVEIDDIETITATIRAEYAVFSVELHGHLNHDRDIDLAWEEVRRQLKEAAKDFPDGVGEVTLTTDMLETESVLFAITGSGDALQLDEAAEQLKSALLDLEEVASVNLAGDPRDQITVIYDDLAGRRLGIQATELVEQLLGRNNFVPGGTLKVDGKTVMIQPQASFQTLAEIEDSPIRLPSGVVVPLKEIARVRRGPGEPESERMRYNGAMAVGVGAVPRDAINLVRFGRKVRDVANRLAPSIAPLQIETITYQPGRVEHRLDDLGRSLLMGIALLAVLLIGLMGIRLGFVVAVVVPLVTFSALAVFHFGGGILHQISMAALVISLGLLVDNAIVIAESVQWHLDRGESSTAAATKAVKELALPLLFATGTTLAAFLPMLLAVGNVGNFTRAIPQVIMLTLGVSYLFAIFLTPILASRILQPKKKKKSRALHSLSSILVRFSVHRPILALAFVFGMLVIAGSGLVLVQRQFFPEADRNQLLVSITMPEGTHLDGTDAATLKLERTLREWPEVSTYSAFVGRSSPQFYYNLPREPKSPHLAQVLITTSTKAILPALTDKLYRWSEAHLPETVLVVRTMAQGPPVDAPIEIRVYADAFDDLQKATTAVFQKVRDTPGTVAVRHDLGQGMAAFQFRVDDAVAARAGLVRGQVAQALIARTRGLPAGEFRYSRDPVPVVVRTGAGEDTSTEVLPTLTVPNAGGELIPLHGLAHQQVRFLPSAIHHRHRKRMVTVSANLKNGVAYSEVLAELMPQLDPLQHEGVRFTLGGDAEASNEANTAIMAKMPYTLLALFLLLLIEFNSFRRVAIIMMVVPLAAVGVIPGLVLGQQPFGFMSLLGVLALAGIVVNNAIMLLEVADAKRREGSTVTEATTSAIQQRIRPILLTTVTTVFGLLPLALSNSSLWPPMAVAMISGLLAATALSLILVPAMYVLFFRKSNPETKEVMS